MSFDSLRADCQKLILTFAIAAGAGWLCLQLGLPAPYMLGSLFGVWVAGAALPKLQPQLGVARWFHICVVLGLGVLIGTNFTLEAIAQAERWLFTVVAMIGTTILVAALGYCFLRVVNGYDRHLAFLCSIPGGQIEAVVLARELGGKDYVVALFHLTRVVIVFVSTPLLLSLVEGAAAVEQSNARLLAMPSLFELSAAQLAQLLVLAVGGYWLAKLCRLPMPHLLGPTLFSSLLHLLGWVELPRVNEFVILAQLTIGGAIGARLARVSGGEVLQYLRTALASSVLILSAYALVASLIAYYSATGFLAVWLAFVPGGLYEVTLLALVFGFDVAFVAFHHTIRILLIYLCMPGLAAWLRRG